MSDEHLRMSDAEREQAAAELGEHYAQGRLSADEHGERLDRIWAARTRGELAPVFADLPGTAYAAARGLASGDAAGAGRSPRTADGHRSRGRTACGPGGLPTLFLVVLAALLVVTVLTHLPFLLIGLLVWFFVIARARNRHQLQRW